MPRKEIISYLGAKPVLPEPTLALRGCNVGLKGKYLFFRVSEIDLKAVSSAVSDGKLHLSAFTEHSGIQLARRTETAVEERN